MQPFGYIEASSVDQASGLLRNHGDQARIIAGGSDLLSEVKEGVVAPERLISLGLIEDLRGVSREDGGLTIGAMTTIAEVAGHPQVHARYTALAQAAAGLATPQIRNVATLGGNLCQRPRCWYYRHPLTKCLKKGGDRCYALAGSTKYLCVTGGDRCYIVHPSDTAVALTALDAAVEVAGPEGRRMVPIGGFFTGPGQDVLRENILAPGELVTRVHLPPPPSSSPPPSSPGEDSSAGDGLYRSLYLKARERESGDFALVSVAAAISVEADRVGRAAVALGGVAPTPYQARRVEEYLSGRPLAEVDPGQAGGLALPDARPMAENGYKVSLAQNLVERAIARLLASPSPAA